ncbi:M55 family metallopeptidase [Tepidanaerobacter acetatoxydans]|uniref:M55 family metallopeptidase n=1 Tax=Tepidanaerobacter acetatoxydans TaxID=499229 RepID=UPI001BD3045F
MKIYISTDMEGISGITSMHQINSGAREYERARRMMTREVNAVIEAAFENGAKDIVINDAHGDMDNILIEELDSRVSLISGSLKPLSMMEGIDESFDAVFFVGYHARAGSSESIIDHTYTFRVLEAKINGRPVSEAGLNGRLAGYYHVPVAFVSGDQNAIRCAREELNEHVGVAVKRALGRTAAVIYPFSQVEARLKAGVAEAMKKIPSFKPTVEKDPVELEVTFTVSDMSAIAQLIPGVTRKDARTVIYTGRDYLETYKVFRVMLALTSGII